MSLMGPGRCSSIREAITITCIDITWIGASLAFNKITQPVRVLIKKIPVQVYRDKMNMTRGDPLILLQVSSDNVSPRCACSFSCDVLLTLVCHAFLLENFVIHSARLIGSFGEGIMNTVTHFLENEVKYTNLDFLRIIFNIQ